MPAGRRFRFAAAAFLTATLVPLAISQDLDPVKQRDAQKKVQAQVEETARRASSTIDALLYQRLSPKLEQKMLEEVADNLRGLSQDNIKQILDHLEAAVVAPDPAVANKEQIAAYQKHREVIAQLRGMLVKLDVIRNLDEAANRLDRAANDQLGINGETLNAATLPPPRRGRGRGLVPDAREDLMDRQAALRAEVAAVFRQIDALLPFLTPEQKARVENADVRNRGTRLVSEMDQTTRTLQGGAFDDAAERQRRHAKEMKDIAAALRTPPANKEAALRAAREKIEKAIEAQTKVNEDTVKKSDPSDPDARQPDVKQSRGNELAVAQTKAEFDTNDARKAAADVAPDAAKQLAEAQEEQWKAEDRLREGDLNRAKPPQEKALDSLKAAKEEIDRQIAAAELAKKDPLAAVKNAAEQIDQLIKEQKDAADKTEKAEDAPAKLPEAATAQKDVTKKTDEVRNTPLPPNEDVKKALDKANDAQKQANKNLDNQKPTDAKPNQQDAIKALEDAKAALDQQAKEIEKRRDDIAKLEDAKKKLDELIRDEKDIAKDAKKAADATNDDQKNPDGTPKNPDEKNADPNAKNPDGTPKNPDPKNGDPKNADPKNPDPKKGDPKNGDPKNGDPKSSDPKNADPKNAKNPDGTPKTPNAKPNAPDTKDLAKKQGDLQPPTQDVAKDLKDVAPDAAQKVNEAGMKQEGAKNDLAKNQPMPGSEKATDAAKKLEEAAKDVDNKLAEKRGQEANDQAALKQNNVDPNAAQQQLQKALDQANMAQQKANEANQAVQQPMDGQQQPMNGQQQPNLADLQKQIAKQAADQKLPDAAKAADNAAKAIEQGKIPDALQNQQKALDALNKAASQPMPGNMGMPMGGDKGMGMPMGGDKGMQPGMGQTPGDLAKNQEKLIDATRALQQSQQANNAAQAALNQAQGNAPMAVQPQLGQANDALNMAQNQLNQGQPGQAGMSQQNAQQALQQALDALNAANMANNGMQPGQQPGMGMANNGMQPGMGMGQQPGMGMGQQPGMGMANNGMQPGQQPGQNPGPGQQANNMNPSQGDENGSEKLKNSASSKNNTSGDGAFINLRSRERDKVQQNAEAQFPAEFRELIKQYNINIKNNKPAMPGAPAVPGGR